MSRLLVTTTNLEEIRKTRELLEGCKKNKKDRNLYHETLGAHTKKKSGTTTTKSVLSAPKLKVGRTCYTSKTIVNIIMAKTGNRGRMG